MKKPFFFFEFLWFDFWVGLYWDRKKKTLYFCPLPMCVLGFDFRPFKEIVEDRFTIELSPEQHHEFISFIPEEEE